MFLEKFYEQFLNVTILGFYNILQIIFEQSYLHYSQLSQLHNYI